MYGHSTAFSYGTHRPPQKTKKRWRKRQLMLRVVGVTPAKDCPQMTFLATRSVENRHHYSVNTGNCWQDKVTNQ